MKQQELSHTLRKEAIVQGHSVQTIASGNSMFPFIRDGDILTIQPTPIEHIKRGDIAVYESAEKWIAHRVIHISSNNGILQIVTRGDARISNDELIIKENYIGSVITLERNKKTISLTSLRKKISTQIHLTGGLLLSYPLNFLARKN